MTESKPLTMREARASLAKCDPPVTVRRTRAGDFHIRCGKCSYFTNDLMDAVATGLTMAHDASKEQL